MNDPVDARTPEALEAAISEIRRRRPDLVHERYPLVRLADGRLAAVRLARAVAPRLRPGPVPDEHRERLIRLVLDLREPDGTWPTQEAVAAVRGCTTRWVQVVQGPGGWAGILASAEQLQGR